MKNFLWGVGQQRRLSKSLLPLPGIRCALCAVDIKKTMPEFDLFYL